MKRALIAILAICAAATVFAATQELRVEEAVICRAVVDRTPQDSGETFPADVGELFCYTKIFGGSEGTMITHVWKRGGTRMAAVDLGVGGSPWRTWSSKTIDPGWSGAWTVEVQDAQGNVLQTLNFTIE
jgi:hypothetical protein